MNESLRQAVVEFLNLQGEAVYPAAAIILDDDNVIQFRNEADGDWEYHYPNLHEFAQFLLEYSIV